MTRKDYELIAAVFKSFIDVDREVIELMHRQHGEAQPRDFTRLSRTMLVADRMASELEQDNTRFNRATFKKACGL
jgi:hypothetical protein